MSNEALLNCPFCGHEGNTVTGEPGMYEILCVGCDHACFAYFHTKAMAIAAWNTRTAPVEGQPVQADVWEPVPDGEIVLHSEIERDTGWLSRVTLTVSGDGSNIEIEDKGWNKQDAYIGGQYRLCRKRPAAEAGA